jgi:hypothetical protein
MLARYTSNPCDDGTENWYVWNINDLGEMARFVGSMEDCGLVSDALNKVARYQQAVHLSLDKREA